MPKIKGLTAYQRREEMMNTAAEKLALVIRKYTAAAGLSRTALVKRFGANLCSYGTFTCRFNNPRTMLFENVVLLCNELHIPPEELTATIYGGT